jgi:hypothetical protein
MHGRTSNIKISLTREQCETLEGLLRRQKTPVGLAKRARAILLLAKGERFSQTAERVGRLRTPSAEVGKTLYRAGSRKLARATSTGQSRGFFPLKSRCT